jgi:lipoprotein-releasing system ATP-binding protein
MIDIKGIKKSFGSLEVLKGIDLHIDKGEVVSIVGPSGAGKTTLLQIIGTLDRPDTGTITIDGIDVSKLSSKKLSDFRNSISVSYSKFTHCYLSSPQKRKS